VISLPIRVGECNGDISAVGRTPNHGTCLSKNIMIQRGESASKGNPMVLSLTDYQRRLAEHRIMFDHPLAPDVEEAVHRASLACAENPRKRLI
jgi:hypothetical protein